jgi:spore germination protein GerM
MAYGSRSKKSSQPSVGCLFWLLLICVVLLLFLLNWGKIQETLKKTNFTEIVKTSRSADDSKQPLVPPPEPAPKIDGDSPSAPSANQAPLAPTPVAPSRAPAAGAKDKDIVVGPGASTQLPAETQPENPAANRAAPLAPAAQAPSAQAPAQKTPAQGGPSAQKTSPSASKGSDGSAPAGKASDASASTRSAFLYFVHIDDDGTIVRQEVKRQIPGSDSPLTDSLNALLGGPSSEEMRRHLVSLIPAGTKLLSAQVRGGTVFLNFNEAFMYNHYGIEGYAGQLKQVVYTATAFSTVQDVQILIDGERHDYLGGEGVYIGKPLSRSSF